MLRLLRYKSRAILLSGLYVGLNARKIARFASLPYVFVATITRRLRANGIWQGDKITSDWLDKKTGGCAFWLDAAVGAGYLERTLA